MKSKQKENNSLMTGQMGELLTAFQLVKMGYPTEIVRLEKIDLLTLVGGRKPLRVQVKASSCKREYDTRKRGKRRPYSTYHFSVCSGGHPKQPLTKEDCDIVALVAIDLEKIIFLRTKELEGRVTKRIGPTKFYDGCTRTTWDNCLRYKSQLTV